MPNITTAITSLDGKFTTGDLEFKNGFVFAKEAAVKSAGKNARANVVSFEPLPVFTASVDTAGNVAAIMFEVSGDKLLANRPENVKLLKLLSADKGTFFKYVSVSADYGNGHGKFTVKSSDFSVYTGTIDKTATYKVVLFIKDGGSFDLDGFADKKLIDPVAFVGTKSNGGRGCGGIGWNAGFPFLALALVPLVLRKRK